MVCLYKLLLVIMFGQGWKNLTGNILFLSLDFNWLIRGKKILQIHQKGKATHHFKEYEQIFEYAFG